MLAEFDSEGEADVTESDDGKRGVL
jgi:hypothetical protein